MNSSNSLFVTKGCKTARRLLPANGTRLAWAALASLFLIAALGCAAPANKADKATNDKPESKLPPAYFVPAKAYAASSAPARPAPSAASLSEPPTARSAKVWLYTSPASEAYLSAVGLSAKANSRVWENFLRKYKFPFEAIGSAQALEAAAAGVLILPSQVALSAREKQAILDFRARGGAVLGSWLTGVRDDSGQWQGFGFTEQALDARVIGDSAADAEDNFLMPYGSSPVSYSLAAGQRIWLERVPQMLPLRLEGAQAAARIMDWSRTFDTKKVSIAIVFNEAVQSSGRLSRSVMFAYTERLWLSADPKQTEALAHNALMWLMRQTDAYLAAWPHPYRSGFTMAIDTAEVITANDLDLAKRLEGVSARGSYYILSMNAVKSADSLKVLQTRGHDIHYMGDIFEAFRDQSSSEQAKRLDAMRKQIKEAGIELPATAGFHAPMEAHDETTEKLLRERGFGHYIAFQDASDARLPFVTAKDSDKPLVVLPRTQNGPEDAMEFGDPDEGLANFLGETDLSHDMGSLSVVRIPNQHLLTKEQVDAIFEHLKKKQAQMWLSTSSKLANWWLERERVSVSMMPGTPNPVLRVRIAGKTALSQPVAVWINLPHAQDALRLIDADGKTTSTPEITRIDAWRAAVMLQGMAPGDYQWQLGFDSSPPANKP